MALCARVYICLYLRVVFVYVAMTLLDFIMDDLDFIMESHTPEAAHQIYEEAGVAQPRGLPSGSMMSVPGEIALRQREGTVSLAQSDHQGTIFFSAYILDICR